METNPTSAQEHPVQLIDPVTPQPQLPTDFEPSASEDTLLYDPAKAARITECLCELLKPSYILLFGTLADGTPHSGTLTYDLLVVVEGKTPYTWYDAKRYLRMMMPKLGHGAPYVNIYVMTQQEVDANFTPFVYLICREGLILYQSTGGIEGVSSTSLNRRYFGSVFDNFKLIELTLYQYSRPQSVVGYINLRERISWSLLPRPRSTPS